MYNNPFKKNLDRKPPAPRRPLSAVDLRPPQAERDVLQAVVHRRLAFKLGLTLPVAATVAALAGLGPNDRGGR